MLNRRERYKSTPTVTISLLIRGTLPVKMTSFYDPNLSVLVPDLVLVLDDRYTVEMRDSRYRE